MTPRVKRIIVPILSFVTLVALACTCGGASGTPTAPPATTAPPTKPPVQLPTEPVATKPPIGGQTPVSGGGAIELSSDVYTHPSGAFSTTYPVGWESNERDDGTYFGEPNGTASMDINFTNIGTELDSEGFDTFVNNIEANWFASNFENYVEESREPQDDGSLLVLKTLTDDSGNDMTVFSYYWQVDNVVYGQDFWSTTDQYDAYVDGFVDIANSIETFAETGATEPLYVFQYSFTCPDSLCSFDVPYAWSYSRNEDYNFTLIDQFKSPDGNALIENVVYDDGNAISQVKGQFALALLKEFYEVQDIVVTDDQVQQDGSERLTWYSREGGYSGESFFETRGATTFLMLTYAANDAFYDLYSDVWSGMLDTYAIP
jgi:hypothetical protein